MLEEERQSELQFDENQNVYGNQKEELSRGQKIAAFGLGFFAFFIVIIWALQFKSGITDPLDYEKAIERAQQNQTQNSTQSELCPSGTCSDLTDDDLRTKDTDGDGLWDWDELHVYSTSPYLEDSDSDGFSDKEEIDSENNPTCAAGLECDTALQIENNAQADLSEFDVDPEDLNLDAFEDLISESNFQAPNSSDSAVKADELRQVLRSSGISEEILEVFSDEELIQIYSQALSGTN